MKTLVIGMDGAQRDTFQRGWTPFLWSLIEQGASLSPYEDLISRGWAEIFTGQHATRTGAMYERPLMDGTYHWTDKFSLGDMPGVGEAIRPIWQVLNESGYRVGIMNVPTTFPAPEVDGFFVSGGGGGGGLRQSVTAEQCHPSEIADTLNQSSYILDERLPSLLGEKQLYEPGAFFDRLREVSQRRTSAFIELANQHPVDFGFLVYKSKIVTTETLLLPELERLGRGAAVNQEFIDAAARFYGAFDEHVRRLVEAFPSAQVLLVSDHSMAPRQWSVNFNALLQRHGLQQRSGYRRTTYDVARSLRFWIPRSLRERLKASPRVKSTYMSMTPFDTKASQAFTISVTNATHGIYVNDAARFGGPVSHTDIADVIDRIVLAVNGDTEAQAHGIAARVHGYGETPQAQQFPDVVIDMPDGYAPSTAWSDFLSPYKAGAEPIDLREIQKDRRVSCKAHRPVATLVRGEWLGADLSGSCDLTSVYRHILESLS